MRNNFVFRYIVISLFCSFIFLFPSLVKASNYIDDFSNADSLSHYTVYQNGGSVLVESGELILSSPYGNNQYPYLILNNDELILPYKEVEIRFKYSSIGRFGAGISVDEIYPDNGSVYDIGHESLIWTWNWDDPAKARFGYYSFIYQDIIPQSEFHTIKISGNQGFYSVYLDNIFQANITSLKAMKSLWIGNPEIVRTADEWPTIIIDKISVIDSSIASNTFPYLSQKDPLWGNKEYDSATEWAGIEKSGIDRWGCALTSATMILQKYQIKSLEDTTLTPDILNTWLKNEPDGYIGPGLINWLAITRYVKDSFTLGHAATKLEFVRSYIPTVPVLPAILGLPGHFVVAYDEEATNWTINDPATTTKTTLAKTSTVRSINRYVPSNTDLSYMMFVASDTLSLDLKDEMGANVTIDWTDEYLTDDIDGNEGSKLRVGMIAKPTDGKYLLSTSSPADTEEELKIYLYDNLAQVTTKVLTLTEQNNTFDLKYSRDPENAREITWLDTAPPSIPTNGSPNGSYLPTNEFDFKWDASTDNASDTITYEFQSSLNQTESEEILTMGLWKSDILTSNMIHSSGAPDGTWYWQVRSRDSVGNVSQWSPIWTVTLDHSAPLADIVFPDPGASSNYFDVIFSEFVDPVEATSGANYFLSNWPGAGGSGDLVGDAEITYNPFSKTVHVLFTNAGWYISPEQLWGVQNISDLAGNLVTTNPTTEYSTPMTMPNLTTAPTTSPNPSNLLNQTWSWLAATDIGSGIKGYDTRTYNVATDEYLSDWLWIGKVLGTSTNLGEGSWQLALRATDNAGNMSPSLSSSTLIVDTTNPSTPVNLHFDDPSIICGGYTNQKLVTVDWDDATDNNRVASYEYNIDYPLGQTRGSWTTSFTTSSYRGSLNEGTHYLKIRSKDTAGNYSPWSNLCSITYDPIAPLVTIDAWGSTINGTAKDNMSGIDKVEIKIKKPDNSESTVIAIGKANWSYTMSEAPYGNYRIAVTSFDIAGNISDESIKEFIMSPPSQNSTPTTSSNVLGASTQNISEYSTATPKPTFSPNPENGAVLGETSTEIKKQTNWWWILVPIIILLLFVSTFLKSKGHKD